MKITDMRVGMSVVMVSPVSCVGVEGKVYSIDPYEDTAVITVTKVPRDCERSLNVGDRFGGWMAYRYKPALRGFKDWAKQMDERNSHV